MRKKIFISLMSMGLACMVLMAAITSFLYWRSIQDQAERDLDTSISIISETLQSSHYQLAFLHDVAAAGKGNLRITWVNGDGTIRFESDYDKVNMENHIDRPEIKEAMETGHGRATRDSRTLEKDLYYTAQRLNDGSVLRLGVERDTVFSYWRSFLFIITILLVVLSLCCIKVAHVFANNLILPVQRTVTIMRRISDPESPEPKTLSQIDSELRPFIEKVVEQREEITHTIRTLEKQRNTVRLMMENLHEGVILTDGIFRIVGFNGWAANLLDCRSREKIFGKNVLTIAPEPVAEALRHMGANQITNRKFSINETQYAMTAQAVQGMDEFDGILIIINDITEQERREQLRREFTSNVSHELKTPLTSISGFAEILAAHLYQSDDDVVHFASLIQGEAKRLLELIEETMHLTRIEEGRRPFVPTTVSLKNIVTDIVSFMEPVLQEKKVTIHCKMEDTTFIGDKGLIREAVMNLIDNAVKYNRPGGHVYVTVKAEDGRMRFTVRDTGIGIPQDKQSRVFERFYRADSSRSRKISGTGLGLSIVKHIVEQHDGDITLKSREGEGTEITLSFPMQRL